MANVKILLAVVSFALLFVSCINEKVAVCDQNRYLNSRFGCVLHDWQFQYQGQWYPATVPGNIHDDLMQNQLIPDPFMGTNEDSVQWVSDSIWTYRLIFDGECGSENDFNHHELVFDGRDTYAEGFLNGKRLETIDGDSLAINMFRRWSFDVSDLLKENDNELIVTFLPSQFMDSIAKTSVSFAMPDNRVFSRKAQYESGWDWGPKLNTCGIWKSVYIRSWRDFKTDNLYVKDINSSIDTMEVWDCQVEMDVEAERDMRAQVVVEYFCDAQSDTQMSRQVVKQKVQLRQGANHLSVPVSIKNPKLWWPNGMGEQDRYVFVVKMRYKGKTYESRAGVNTSMVQHGLRTITLKRESDTIGESFEFWVNDKPCYVRGANWIPATSYAGRLARPEGNEHYYQLLHDCKTVNMNMIRVWGGGLYENDDFYDYCDQLGLLVWQDFTYACNPYPGDSLFVQNARQEAVEQVLRLRNHPCLATWCGNNEVHNGLMDWGWQAALQWTDTQYQKLLGDFHQLFEVTLPEVLQTYAPDANYISSSPTYGWGHDECCTHGCSHYWGVWWGEEPFEMYWKKTGRFMTEYGFQSYPEMATWETTVDSTMMDALRLGSPTLNNHQKHGRGVEIIRKAMLNDFGYTRTDDLAHFAYISQLVQAYGIVQAIDAHRIQHDKCRGTLYWQLNDCWPVASWSSIDYTGRWKALHYRLKDAYANVSIATHLSEDGSLQLFVVNDSLYDFKGGLHYDIIRLDGSGVINQGEKEVLAKSNSATAAMVIDSETLKGENPQNVCVKLQYRVNAKTLAQRLAYLSKPKALNLKRSDLQIEVRYLEDCIEVSMQSPTLLYGLFLEETSGKMIRWSDNYFDLLPNETKVVRGYYEGDGQPSVRVLSF